MLTRPAPTTIVVCDEDIAGDMDNNEDEARPANVCVIKKCRERIYQSFAAVLCSLLSCLDNLIVYSCIVVIVASDPNPA